MSNTSYRVLSELEAMQYISKIQDYFQKMLNYLQGNRRRESKSSIPYNGTRFFR
jgi:hypothetical protein